MTSFSFPKKIVFATHGASVIGYLTAVDRQNLPFPVKRVFWTYFTPERIIRGKHAHKRTTVIVFALTGKIIITTETIRGIKQTFVLDKPNVGLLIPPMIWHTQRYSHTAIQLVLASRPFDEKEYVRNYKDFQEYAKKI